MSASSTDAHHQNQLHSWVKPVAGLLKCNVDAAFFTQEKACGVGMCLRNESGIFIQARVMRHTPLLNVREGEAIGLLEAIKWVCSLGLDNVIFDSSNSSNSSS